MKKLLLLALLASTPLSAQVVYSPVQQIQGTAAVNRGNAVNVRLTDGSGSAVTSTTPTGTAGSPSTDVVSVQGVAGGTAQPVSQSGTWNITNVSGTVSLPTGAATDSALTTINTTSSSTNTDLGAPGATACATDTGSCSLNALNQRIAQRLTTVNTTLGSPFQAGASIGNSSFAATQATASSLNAQVVGSIASGSADSGNPVKVGGRYNSTRPTFSDAQRGDLQLGTRGSLSVQQMLPDSVSTVTTSATNLDSITNTRNVYITDNDNYAYNGSTWDRVRGDANAVAVQPALSANFWSYAAATGGITNTNTAVTVKAAAGASTRNYITSIQIDFGTLGTATEFAVRDGAAGTVLWRMNIPAGVAGMREVTFAVPLRGTANTLVEVLTLTASTTGSVFVNVQGYTGI